MLFNRQLKTIQFMNAFMNRLLLIVLLLGTALSSHAQKVSFDDVLSIQLRNMGPILEDNQVKGYYMFYKVDKVDRKNNAFLLRILDENLRDVAKKRFVNSKHTVLTEAAYNGKAFLFSFLDAKEKVLKLTTYDKEMTRLGSQKIELDKWGMSQYQTQLSSSRKEEEASDSKMIFPMGDHGFARYNLVKNKKVGYEIEYLPNDLKRKESWNKKSPENSKVMLMAGFADASDKYLVSAVTTKPKLLSNKNLTFLLQTIELETQKVVFEKELKSSKYIYSFMNATISEDQKSIMVLGEYFNSSDNILKDRSQGLYALEYDMTGKVIKEEHHSWTGAISKKVKVGKKGKIDDKGYIAFHKILKSANGHYYAIGEQYKKAASGAGIAIAALGGRASVMKMVVMDLVIFDLNPDLSLNDVQIFEKEKQNIILPAGMGHQPPTLLSYYIRAYGAFDYSFTQLNEDNSSFFSTYASTEKKKGEKRKSYFGIISHTDGDEDYVLDKIDLETDATRINVFPAKPGYILLTEYYKKKKKLESRLEKINY